MGSTADTTDYTSWTPEQLMRDYHGELKKELFLRCMEWYTNSEVEAKINAGRTDGSKIQNSNFYAEFKRIMDATALCDGHLPSEYRLEFDKRRCSNVEARFGPDNFTAKAMRATVQKREAIRFPTLSANPSLAELEAARPDNGKKLQKGRETKDYWYKFLAATQRYTEEQIRVTYDMAPSTAHQEINRAKRIVARLREIEHVERAGGSIQQTYKPPPLLRPGQQIYTMRVMSTKSLSLLSFRMKSTLSRLRHELDEHSRSPPSLASLAGRFEPLIECVDMTERERQAFATCETGETLAAYQAWCETVGAKIVRKNDPVRISSCLSHVIRHWRDEIMEAEDAGVRELEETFLQVVMRRLEDMDAVERQMRREEMKYDAWARVVECGR